MEHQHIGTPPHRTWRAGTLTYTSAGIVGLFCWLLWGDFAWALKERSVGYVAQLMVKSFEITDFGYTVLMVSVPCLSNLFLMPVISFRSDRHRGKYGRRIPYLAMFTPLVVIGLIGLGLAPMLGKIVHQWIGPDKIALNMVSLIVFGFFWIILDIGTSLTNAIFVALANDVVPPQLIGRFLALFRMVSLCCAVFFSYHLLGIAEVYGSYIFIALGIFYFVGLYSVCLKVKEGEYPPPDTEGTDRPKDFFSAAKVYFGECFSDPYYRWVIIAQTCCMQSMLPINIFAIFYAKSLNLNMDLFGKISAATFLVAVLSSFFLGLLSDKFHPVRTGMVAMALMLSVQLSACFLIHDVRSFLIVYFIHEILAMSFNTLTASYAPRLFPKVLYAQFNSALQMLLAITSLVIAPVGGFILDRTGNNYALTFLMGGIIGAAGLLSLVMVFRGYLKYGGDANYQPPLPAVWHRRGAEAGEVCK
ncbi:MAG: MFS transporter [Victivallaceae bacterium]